MRAIARGLLGEIDNVRVIDVRELTRSSGVDGQAPTHIVCPCAEGAVRL